MAQTLPNKTVPIPPFTREMGIHRLIFTFKQEAHKAEWSQDEIDLVIDEAITRDFEYFITTINTYCNGKEEKEI